MGLRKSPKVLVVILLMTFISFGSVYAIDDLFSIQGNVQSSGVDLASGNLTVTIYDAYSGGNMVYNTSGTYNDTISDGKYDVVLGNSSVDLSLEYGKFYYMELYINNEKITFQNGAGRQIFQSSVGNISIEDIDFSSKMVLNNQSSSFAAGQNLTLTGNGYFKGLFNWIVNSSWGSYIYFNGSDLSLSDYANATYTSTYNATYAPFAYNESTFVLLQISNQNSSWISTYNATYALYSYNQTTAGDTRFVNTDGDNMSGLLTITSGGLNVTAGLVDFYGGWLSNGVSIRQGSIYAQTLYVYNITSLGVNNLDVNGSIVPYFNDTFDIGNDTSRYRNGYFGTELYIRNLAISPWLYNESTFVLLQISNQNVSWISTYNSTYAPWSYNQTIASGWNKSGNNLFPGDLNDNVSVGTTGSEYKFAVSTSANQLANFTSTSGGNSNILAQSTGNIYLDLRSDIDTGAANDAVLRFYESGTGRYSLGYDASNDIFQIDAGVTTLGDSPDFTISSTGNVGIGTTAPSHLLTLQSSSTNYILNITSTGAGGDFASFIGETGDPVFQFDSGGTGGEGLQKIYSDGLLDIQLSAHPRSNSFINSSMLGVGTSNPTHKLTVRGNFSIVNSTLGALTVFNDSGALGIGTAYPTHELNVVGSANITGDLISKTIYDISSQGLVFAMNFNNESINNNIVLDSSGNNRHGNFVGVVQKYNETLGFNGGGTYSFNVTGALNAGLLNTSFNDYSISFWGKWNEFGGTRRIISNRQSSPGNQGWEIRTTSAAQVDYVMWFDDITNTSATSSVTGLSTNTWYYIVVTVNRTGNQTIYLNGNVFDVDNIEKNSSGGDRSTVSVEANASFCIGGSTTCVSGSHNGSIDDVRIYSRILSADEVKQLYYQKTEVVDSYVSQRNIFIQNVTGNVGIGTTNPKSTLDVIGSLIASNDLNSSNLYIKNKTAIGNTALPIATLTVTGNVSISENLTVANLFFVNASGISIGVQKTDSLFQIKNSANSLNVSGILYANDSSVGIGDRTVNPLSNFIGEGIIIYHKNLTSRLRSPTSLTATPNVAGSGLNPANNYYYKVVAISSNGVSLPSPEAFCDLQGVEQDCDLNWDDVDGAIDYRIYRGTSSNGENVYLDMGSVVAVTSSFSDDDNPALDDVGTPPTYANGTLFILDTNGDLYTDGDINLVGAGDNLTFTSSGGITFTGGTISDATDGVDIADNLEIGNNLTITGAGIIQGNLYFGTSATSGRYEFGDGSLCIGDGGCVAPAGDGALVVEDYAYIVGVLNVSGTIIANSTTTAILAHGDIITSATGDHFIAQDGGLVVDDDGTVTTPSDGYIIVDNAIATGGAANTAYNAFGGSNATHAATSADVFISGTLEVNNPAYLKGNAQGTAGFYWTQADIAENIHTKESRNNLACGGDVSCWKNSTTDDLDYGDLVCIDPKEKLTIAKCNQANSNLAIGFVSKTFVLNVGSDNGYPIALAGLVPARLTNENGNIVPGDLLVSSSRPGYAMKNNNPTDGTVVGKAFDFCDKDECEDVAVFVALS